MRAVTAFLGSLSLLSACGGDPDGEAARNVLVISVDTVRRDALGFMGRSPSPSPNVDGLAAEAAVFDDAYTVTPLTLPAHTSLLTGLYPASHGVRDNGAMRVPGAADTLAELFQRRGYRTLASVAAFVLDRCFGLDQGFERYGAPPRSIGGVEVNVTQIRANEAVDRLLRDLDELGGGGAPWFAWLHLYDPHAPYDAPGFASGKTRAAYDDEIRFADGELGRLFRALKERGVWEELVVVFTSDHGEGLEDGREPTHGHFVYDQTMRIPLLIKHPEIAPGRIAEPVSLVDVAPTLLTLLRVPADERAFDGRNLAPLLRGEPAPEERTLLIECYKPWIANGWSPFEGGVRGPHKFIRAHGRELYDRVADPAERTNLYAPDDATAAALGEEVERRMTELAGKLEREQVELSTGAEDALAALGYVGAGAALGVEGRPDFDALADPYEMHPLILRMDALSLALAKQDWPTAIAELRELVALDPQNPLFLERLGEILAFTGPEHLDEAEELLGRAFELRPGRPRVHLGLSHCARQRADAAWARYTASGREDAAARAEWERQIERLTGELRAVLALEPDHPSALFNLGFTLTRRGDEAEAGKRELYVEALALMERLLEVVPREDPRWKGFAQSRDSLTQRIAAL